MKDIKIICLFGLVLSLFSCKKDAPEPERQEERDNKIVAINTSTLYGTTYPTEEAYTINGLPGSGRDSIYGFIFCERPSKYFLYKGQPFYYLPAEPKSVYHTPVYPYPNIYVSAYNNDADSSDLIIKFHFVGINYKLHSKRWFSSVIFDNRYRGFEGNLVPNQPYSIKFNDQNKNTDTIINYGTNKVIHLTDTLVTLQTYTPNNHWPKPSYYKIIFRNFSHVRLHGKLFLIINDATYSYVAG